MNKRILSILLAITLLVSCVSVLFMTTYALDDDKLVIADCDTTDGWVTTGGNALKSDGKTVYCGINYGAFRQKTFTATSPLDISEYQTIEWDIKFEKDIWDSIVASYGTNGNNTFFLRLNSNNDGSQKRVYFLSKIAVTDGENGWLHLSVNINDSNTNVNFDDKHLTTFYFATCDGGVDTKIANGRFDMDNIVAVKQTTTPPDDDDDTPTENKVISECEEIGTEWTYPSNPSFLAVTTNGMTGKAIHITYTGYGALRKLTFSKEMNLKGYNTVEFDMYCMKNGDTTHSYPMWDDIANTYSDKIGVEIASNAGTALVKYDKWEVTPLGNCWYHVVVPVFNPTSGKASLESFNSFSVYANTTGQLDNTLSSAVFYFDNLIASYKDVNPDEEDPQSDGIWKIPGTYQKTASSTFSIQTSDGAFSYDLSSYKDSELYLTMDITVTNTNNTDDISGFGTEGQLELTSSGKPDLEENNWSVPKLNLKPGLNKIRLNLSSANKVNGGLKLSNINYLRFYATISSGTYNVKIENIELTNKKEVSIVSTYFTDGMMFQQNKPMKVFGNTGAKDTVVKAILKKGSTTVETKEDTTDENGEFSVAFSPLKGGYEYYTIELYTDGKLNKTIKNILIGELWLAAGQSNMEYFVLQTIKDYDYSLIPTNEFIRFYDEPLVPGGVDSILPAVPANDIEGASWSNGSTAANVRYVSAIAYYMSLKLQSELDVPVGFVNAAKGASVIESWLPRESVENNSVIKSTLENRGIYLDNEQLSKTSRNWEKLTTLYNTKIAPLGNIEIAGMLWYQGESNIKYADADGYNTFYENALLELISAYGKQFGYDSDMPIACAHLAPYSYKSIRSEDYTTIEATFSEMLKNVGDKTSAKMIQIPIYDLSLLYSDPPTNNPDPIHPNSKKEVGKRFADAVLSGVYDRGDKEAYTAPYVSKIEFNSGKAVLTFNNAGAGLKILNGENTLHGFAIADSSRVFTHADAKIIAPDKIEVSSKFVTNPVAVTYAWSSFNMLSNLANANDIPAIPYRSDRIKSVYYLSMDWGYAEDLKAWDALTSLDAGYKDAYRLSNNTVASLSSDALEGNASVKLTYNMESGKKVFVAPVLDLGGMIKQFAFYEGLTVSLKNSDSRSKKVSLEIDAGDETFYATVITGTKLDKEYTLPSGDWNEFTFNFVRLMNNDGNVLDDSSTVLKTATAIRLCVFDTKSGSVQFDKAILRTDKLPTPGSENDNIVEGIVDTTPGAVNKNGNAMWFADCESKDGWSASGTTLVTDTENHTQGKASIGASTVGGNIKQIAYSIGKSIDASEYDFLEFDMYCSNMNWFNACETLMFELTSSGTSDNESNRYMKGYLRDNLPEFYNAGMANVQGGNWYHIKLALAKPQTTARGGLNTSKVNYFRFFEIGSPANTPEADIRFDNFKFTKNASTDTDTPIVSAGDPSYGARDGEDLIMTSGDYLAFWKATRAKVELDFANKTEGKSSVTTTAAGGILAQISFTPDRSIDISDYQYLEFDMYLSNLDWYSKSNAIMFELTSAGTSDKESNRFTKSSIYEASPALAQDIDSGKGGGKWYHFKFTIDQPHAKVKGGLNKKAFNYFRFYSVEMPKGTKDYTLRFDNMRFTKGEVVKIEKTNAYIGINPCESTAGWSASGAEVKLDKNNKTTGNNSVTVTAKNGVLKQLVYTPNEPIDITGYDYLQFDMFLSDISFINTSTGFMVEMTSSGTCDVESNRFMKSGILSACPELAQDVSLGVAGNKWYHFCFNIAKPQSQARGGLNMKNFNYFRIYFIGAKDAPDCVVNIDDLKVTKEGLQGIAGNGGSITSIGNIAAGANVCNKENAGLLGNVLTQWPDSLIKTLTALGIAAVLLVVANVFFWIFALKRKKNKA